MQDLSVYTTQDYLSLNHRQKLAFHAAMAGDNMLILGGGGVGKSYLTRTLVRHLPGLVVLGSTGTAAVNISGQTVDSFFGLGRHFMRIEDAVKVPRALREILHGVKRILIDEFGALRRDRLAIMDHRLRVAKNCNLPFGGVQIIGVGDFCQIKPVLPEKSNEFKLFKDHFGHKDVYPFMNHDYDSYELTPHLLTSYVRQQNAAEQELLKRLRLGRDLPKVLRALHQRISPTKMDEAIVLCCLKRVAARHNEQRYASIGALERVYYAEQEGEVEGEPAPGEIRLKEGVRVVVTVNDQSNGYYNGDIGTVVSMDEAGVNVLLDRGKEVYITPFEWLFYNQTVREDGGVNRKTKGWYQQLPLMLAYGITIHRSQGMTLPAAHVDLTGGFFAEGMPYVSLSRVPSLSSLSLSRQLRPSDIKVNAEAIRVTEHLSHLALNRTAEDEARFRKYFPAQPKVV